jgi:hypothetical protein
MFKVFFIRHLSQFSAIGANASLAIGRKGGNPFASCIYEF